MKVDDQVMNNNIEVKGLVEGTFLWNDWVNYKLIIRCNVAE